VRRIYPANTNEIFKRLERSIRELFHDEWRLILPSCGDLEELIIGWNDRPIRKIDDIRTVVAHANV